jgi:hypothetical protein
LKLTTRTVFGGRLVVKVVIEVEVIVVGTIVVEVVKNVIVVVMKLVVVVNEVVVDVVVLKFHLISACKKGKSIRERQFDRARFRNHHPYSGNQRAPN